jgi:hypothetical protein
MSSISAGTTTGTALVSTGDTTGELVLKTNGTTTAVTIGTDQVVTLAQPLPAASGGTGLTAFPAPGTSGNLLTSDGTSWTSAAAGGVAEQNCSYTGSLVESGSIPFTATTTADLGSNRVVTGMTFDKSPCGVSFSSLKLRGYNIKNTA